MERRRSWEAGLNSCKDEQDDDAAVGTGDHIEAIVDHDQEVPFVSIDEEARPVPSHCAGGVGGGACRCLQRWLVLPARFVVICVL